MHDHAIQPFGIVAEGDIAQRRLAGGAGHHHHHGTGRHDPVRDALLHVLQRLVGEQGAVRVGMRKAGRKTDLQALVGSGAVHGAGSFLL
ncbi:hypothetical protein SDC9_105064 [bioreactor metagenome]|uniref:Uncharacterized protein n=1 Tax=bioreactor metagenome TaxID=1076179 RepID=A0A645B503_9ZZZZ